MKYKITAGYCPPYEMSKIFNIQYDIGSNGVSFSKEPATQFADKSLVDKVLLEIFNNRSSYEHFFEKSDYLELKVHIDENGYGRYGDSMIIKFVK
ncbi:gp333 [Bacillus phage G]|uniref:Gp333 n=1 Tax=Bacillus phage G TaxID=2884420 RepID=G3MA74_9CAUD|nr:gp333 [Bacillus phage G]AEO93592.1 gp333 [Bacillus phage G]